MRPFFISGKRKRVEIIGTMKAAGLDKKIVPTVEGLGCQLWGIQVLPQGGKTLLRVYIDKLGGANLGDCQKVSNQLSALFLVEPPLAGAYLLEVSTPGLDRILFDWAHYESHIGKRLQIRLRVTQAGHRQFQGQLMAVDHEKRSIELMTGEQERVTILFGDIQQARVVPEWPKHAK